AAGDVAQVFEVVTCEDAGGGAGTIAARADDGERARRVEMQAGKIFLSCASGALKACGTCPLAYSGARRTSSTCSSGVVSINSFNSATEICGRVANSRPDARHAATPPRK